MCVGVLQVCSSRGATCFVSCRSNYKQECENNGKLNTSRSSAELVKNYSMNVVDLTLYI